MRKYGVMKLKLKCFKHFKQDIKIKANNIVYNLKTGKTNGTKIQIDDIIELKIMC